jgi:large subunit ribosomal protein L6
MSRIGRKPIELPTGVTLTVEGGSVTAVGPKGTLSLELLPDITVEQAGQTVTVALRRVTPETQKYYGLTRTLIHNMVVGVSQGFSRRLEINGVGYRASVSGTTLNLTLGFSHPIAYALPAGVEAKVEKNVITISGFDKQLVGQVAANVRAMRKPEPYKGKGIKYAGEHIRRKAGKTAAKG